MQTILDYSPLISAVASLLMLAVWTVYLTLFWQSYRRQHRANIVISRGSGAALDSLCLVSNMSAEPVFVEGIIVVAERDGRRWASALTNVGHFGDEQSPGRQPVQEGPLKPSDYVTIGTFRSLLELTDPGRFEGERQPGVDAIEIWVVAGFSSENDVVFARRKFNLKHVGDRTIFRPADFETRRITRAQERREIEEILERHLEEASAGWPEWSAERKRESA